MKPRMLQASYAMMVILVAVALIPSIAWAQAPSDTPLTPARTITVVGEGIVRVKPDIAMATLGVEVVGSTAKAASAQADATMQKLLEVLRTQGIEDKDIQTSGYNIWVERPSSPGMSGASNGKAVYHVSHQVSVTIRDLERAGGVIDAAIEAGANNVFGVTFDVSDKGKYRSEARKEAVADARAKAEELATLTGLSLGNVMSISEVIGGGVVYARGFQAALAAPGAAGGTPITPGEMEVNVQLQLVYEVR